MDIHADKVKKFLDSRDLTYGVYKGATYTGFYLGSEFSQTTIRVGVVSDFTCTTRHNEKHDYKIHSMNQLERLVEKYAS